jgi:peptidoglycan hydrolase CwlO-like protein
MNKERLILPIAGLASGIALALLFRAAPQPAEITINPDDSQQKLLVEVQSKDHRIDSFQQQVGDISQQLKEARKELVIVKQKNTSLQFKVKELMYKKESVSMNDTLAMLKDCDSLTAEIVLLVNNDVIKDSLNVGMDSLYQVQLSLKDSVIQTQQEKYLLLKDAFNLSSEQLQSVASQYKVLKRQVKKQRLMNKLKAAGALLISGAVAGILLMH